MADELREPLRELRQDPANAEALARCEEWLAGKDRWGDLVRLYEDLALRAAPETAAELFNKAGALWRERLGNREGARVAYRRSLRQVENAAALAALAGLASDARDWWLFASLLERQAAVAPDPEQRAELFRQAAGLYQEQLRRPGRAAGLLRQALVASPQRADLFSAELELHRQRGNWAEVGRALEALEDAQPSAEVLTEIYLIAAEALTDAPLQGERALDCLARLDELSPDNPRTAEIRKRIEDDRADWEKRVKTLREAALDAQNKLEASTIYLRVADLYLNQGEDPKKAVENVERSLLLHPGNLGAVQFLERVYGEEGQYAELAQFLEKVVAGLLEDEPRVEVHLKLALLWTAHLEDAERAADHYRMVLRVDGAHPVAVEALKEHYLSAGDHEGCAQLLEDAAAASAVPEWRIAFLREAASNRQQAGDLERARLDCEQILEAEPFDAWALEALIAFYQHAGMFEQQVTTMGRLADLRADQARLQLLVSQARVIEADLQDPARTFDVLARAVALAPTENGLRKELAALAESTGRFRDLARTYEDILEQTDDVEAAVELRFDLAELYKGRLEDYRRAEECYGRLLELDPQNHRAFSALSSLYEMGERWQNLVDLLVSRAEASAAVDPVEAAGDLKRVAALCRERLRSPLQAVEHLRKALELVPGDPEVIQVLRDSLKGERRWGEYAEFLKGQAEAAEEPGVRRALYDEISMVLETQAGDLAGATEAAARIVALAPDDLSAVERVVHLKRQAGDWAGLAEALAHAVTLAGADPQRVSELRVELGAVKEWQLASPAEAADVYAEVLIDDPGATAAIEALERLLGVEEAALKAAHALAPIYEAREDWSRLVRVLQIKLTELEGRARNKLQKKINKLTEQKLKLVDDAFDGYVAAFREEPANATSRGEVERLAAETGRWSDLAVLYREAGEKVEDPAVARELRLAAARLEAERLGRLEEALALYLALRAEQPGDDEVLVALGDLYARLRRHKELAELLVDRAGRQADAAQASALYVQAADLLEELIDDPAGAAVALRGALEHDPENRELLGRLARLYERCEDWAGLAEMLERTLGLAAGAAEQHALKVMLGDLAQERLDDADRAIALYNEVLAEDAENEDALAGLEEFLEDAARRGEVAAQLLPRYLEAEDWNRAIEALEVLAGEAEDPAVRRQRMDEVAGIYRDKLGRKDMLFVVGLRTLRESPEDTALRAELEALAAELGNWDELVATYEAMLATAPEPLQLTLRERLAHVWAEELGEPKAALEHHRALLATDPENTASRQAELSLLRTLGQWDELATALEAEAGRAEAREDQAALRELLVELGAVARERLGDAARAIEAYEALARLDPGDRAVAITRIALYREATRWESLAAALREQADATDDPDLALAHRLDLADVLERELDRTAEAITVYARLLEDEEPAPEAVSALERLSAAGANRRAAAEVLGPYYEAREDWRRLIEVQETRLEEESDPTARRALVLEVASLYEQRLESPALAFVSLCRAFRDDPADSELEEHLRVLAAAAHQEEDLAGVYEEALEADLDGEARIGLALKLADLQAKLEQTEEARNTYRQVLGWDPDNAAAFGGLAALTEEDGDWDEIMGALQDRLARVEDDTQAAMLQTQIGDIQRDKLKDPDAAILSYEAAREQDRENPDILDRLIEIYEGQERWAEYANLMPEKIRPATGEERTELELSHARVLEEELERFDEAVEVYTAVLDRDPKNDEALEALEDLLRVEGVDANRVADVLDPIYVAGRQWDKLIGNYEVRLTQTEDRDLRLEHYKAMADICEGELEQAPAAFYILSRAYGEGFHGAEVEARLFKLAEATDNWEALAKEIAQAAEEADEAERKAALYLRLGRLLRERLDDAVQATTYFEMVLESDPEQTEALKLLADLYHDAENWAEWVRVQRRRIDLWERAEAAREAEAEGEGSEEGAEVAREAEAEGEGSEEGAEVEINLDEEEETLEDLYLDVAATMREELDDAAGAIELLEQARRNGRAVSEVEAELIELYMVEERWSDLAHLLRDRVSETEDPAEAASLLTNLAQIHAGRLDDPDRAIEFYREALERDPGNERAAAGLSSFLADEDRRQQAAQLLSGAREHGGDWRGLAESLEVQIEETPAGPERVELLRKTALVHEEHLSEPDVALACLGRAFRDEPTSTELRDEIERLAEQTERHEVVAGLFEEMAERLQFDDRAAAVDLYVRAADRYIGKLEEAEQAAECYRHVLDVDPEHLEALKGLVEVCRVREAWEDLADALSRTIAVTPAGAELADLIYELGAVYETHLEDENRARENYEQVLSIRPAHKETLEALERVYESAEEWGPLYEVYEKARELTEDAEERVEFTAKMADLAGEELDMRERGIELWREVLEAEPEDVDALEALEELYTATERWPELLEIYRQQLETCVDDEEKIQLFAKLGYLRTEKLKELDQARTDWICVLRLDPNNLTALAMLKTIYEEQEQWEDLTAILKRIASLQKSDDTRKALNLRLAEVYGEHLGRRQDAIAAAKQVLDLDPLTEDELENLAQIFLDNESWDDTAAVLGRKLELAEEVGEQVEVRRQIADLWRERARDEHRAAEEYEAILELLPTNEEAFQALVEIYRSRRDWMRLAAVHEIRGGALIDAGEEPEAAAALFAELGDLYEKRLDDPSKALVAWRRILEVDSGHERARREVERLASETGGFEELAAGMEKLIEDAETPTAAIGLRLARARILREELDRLDEAEEEYEEVLEVDEKNLEALDARIELARAREGWQDLADALESRAAAVEGEDRSEFLSEAAEIYEGRLENRERATELRRELLDLGGAASEAALSDLHESLSEAEDWDTLAESLERAIELAPNDPVRRERRKALAEMCEKNLEDPERAAELYREITKESPRYRPAWKALERLYHKAGKWRELIEVYNKLVALAEEDGERIELYANAAAIWEEEFGERVMAIESLKKILALDPANLGAVGALERLYRQGEEWARLTEIYHKHIALSDDTSEIVALYNKIGEVYEHDLDRTDRAVDSYSQAVNFDPRNKPSLSALARLYEGAGRWERAIEMLERLAAAVEDEEEKTDLLFRAGRLFETEVTKPKKAKKRYRQALEISPGHLPSLKALKTMASNEGDWKAYLPLLIQEEQYTENREDKARLLVQLGRFFWEQEEDLDGAIERFEAALNIEPELDDAVRPLAELLFERERHEEARPLLETALQSADEGETAEASVIHYRLGFIAEQAKDLPAALTHFRAARELDPGFLLCLEGIGRVHVAEQNWAEAQEVYEEILEKHLRGRTDDEALDIYVSLGTAYLEVGRLDDAAALFGRALRVDDGHEPSLAAMVRVCEAREDWEEVINYQERRIEESADPDAKRKILLQMGDVYRDQLDDSYEAIDTYNLALEIDASDFEVNNRLYRLYQETGQWQEAARVLERVLKHEQSEARIAIFRQALGEIYLAKLDEVDKAIACFQAILEIDPTKTEAREAIEDILDEDEDWIGLEEHYRRMIKLTPKRERGQRIELWRKLGELYALRLENVEGAIMAFEVLAKLEPDNYKHLESLAELYQSSEKHRDKAIETYQRLAQVSPVPVLAFKALRRLYAESREYDKVFCVCATLRFLKEATTEEETFYRKFLPKAKMKTTQVITDESWETNLIHEDARGPVSRIFGYLYRYAGNQIAPGTRLQRVKKKDRIDPNDSLLFFCKMFNYVAKAMNVDRPELFRAESMSGGVGVADSYPPAFLLGEAMFKDLPKRDLWYLIGRNLTYVRSEFILSRILPAESLRALFAAVITAFLPRAPAEADPREIEKWQRKVVRALPGEVQDHLLELAREYARDQQAAFDANRWLEAVEYSANRAGFVVCNDLEVSMQQLVAQRGSVGAVPHRSLVRDLVHYSVSEDYFALRNRLGFSIMA